MKWIVISDIHFTNYRFQTSTLRKSLEQKMRDIGQNLDFILITGDCFYQNDASDDTVRQMANFIKRLGRICGVQVGRIYICRGNHDVDRSNNKRNSLVDEARRSKDLKQLSMLSTLGSENFLSLYNMVKGTNVHYKPFMVNEPRRLGVRIITLDTCILSKDDSDSGQLRVCVPELYIIAKSIKNDGKLNIAMMHHGVEMLQPDDARQFQHWLENNNIDIVFSGHTHRAALSHLDEVRRDIIQFTTGALLIDDYAIPSLYLCEGDAHGVTLSLYTFSKDTDDWELDDHHLRKFQHGQYVYIPSRLINQVHNLSSKRAVRSSSINNSAENETATARMACEELIRTLNERYQTKFGSTKIVSSKTDEQESFNAWKIVGSLAGIGIPYPIALKLTCQVLDELVSDSYTRDNILNSTQIKRVVYNTILACKSYPEGTTEYEVGVWASKYGRHYDKETGFVVLIDDRKDQLSYTTLRDSLIKEAVVSITGEAIYYDKIYNNEKIEMANAIMRFIKSLGIFEIRHDILIALISEFMTQRPHPWFVTKDREGIIKYHLEHADLHLGLLSQDAFKLRPVLQIEVAYHVCAAILSRYDEYTGCKESSPVLILFHALRLIEQPNSELPMVRYRVVQMQKDLETLGITMNSMRNLMDLVKENLVSKREVTRQDTAEALIELRHVAGRLKTADETWAIESRSDVFDSLVTLFYGGQGFKVKKPLRHFQGDAFFVDPTWTDEERRAYRLGNSLLVYMLRDDPTFGPTRVKSEYCSPHAMNRLVSYLEMSNKRTIHEVVFVKQDASSFNHRERDYIRLYLKESCVTVLCVFIQERDFVHITELGWRNELLRVIRKSRYSR